MITLSELNSLSPEQAELWFKQTCTASKWCTSMVQSRPYSTIESMKNTAQVHWESMKESDYLEAFEGHPVIGDLSTLRAKYSNTKALAGHEQSGTSLASDDVLNELKDANAKYLNKHGFIFIICASGLSAQSMLESLLTRLPNDRAVELENAAREQLKITLLRFDKGIKQGLPNE